MRLHLPRAVWADRPLRTKGLVLAVLPLLILLSALFWIAGATRAEEAAVDGVHLALSIQDDLGQIETLVYRAALERGTETPAREHLDRAERSLPGLLANLAATIRDAEQRARLEAMTPVAREAVQALQPGHTSDALATGVVNRLEAAVAGMRRREEVLLAQRTARAQMAQQRNFAAVVAAGLLGLLASLGAVLLFTTGIVRQVRVLEINADRLALGQPLAPATSASDEVGRLGAALARASALLSDRQHRLEELVARLFQIQEDERRRVAYDLHDGLAQVAAAAHGHLQAYAERFPPATPAAEHALKTGLDLVQRAVRETRAAIAGLRPTALDDFGLALAVKLELESFRAEGRRIEFDNRLGPERLPPMIETALFRIAQEALYNIRKHAGADACIALILARENGSITLEVRDSGQGMANGWGRAGAGERIGLDAMRERAALLGGTTRIASRPDEGTRVTVSIPEEQGALSDQAL